MNKVFSSFFLLITSFSLLAESSCELDVYLEGKCRKVGEWDINIALGYGQKANPYVYQDDIPLWLLPNISYYGERLYFDSDTLGYTLADQQNYSINIISQLADDSAYFHDWHFANYVSPVNLSSDSFNFDSDYHPDSPTQTPNESDDIEVPPIPNDSVEIPGESDDTKNPIVPEQPNDPDSALALVKFNIDRNVALNAGIEFNHFFEHWSYRVQLLRDISRVHDGYGVIGKASFPWQYNKLRIETRLALKYKSKHWLNYYYGVDEGDTSTREFYYRAGGGTSAYVELVASYPIISQWSLLAHYRYERLSTQITDSPLVDESYLHQWFAGVVYHF